MSLGGRLVGLKSMSGQEVIDLTADVLQQSLSAPGCSTEPTGPAQGTIRGRKRKGKAAAAAEADGEDGPPTKKSRAKKEKKDPPEKRIAFDGRTVRYSKSAPAPTRERIQRALPGTAFSLDFGLCAATPSTSSTPLWTRPVAGG